MTGTPQTDTRTQWLRVRGARTHNLKNIEIDIPRDRFVVITGVSGSGKSSLAFDTIFAEGQRRYLESLSAHTRQFLHQIERPDVDSITGLAPTICIDQRVSAARIRSTLATTTEIYDYMRLLYARAGQAHCPDCREPVSQQSVDSIVDRVMHLEAGRKVMLLAPLISGRKGAHREVFETICKAGFVRARVDNEIVDAATPLDLPRNKAHTIEAIVDRIVVKPGIETRLRESIELALKHGEGTCLVSELDGENWRDRLYSSKCACPKCGVSYPTLEPRTFSFNSPYGACPTCRGLGRAETEDANEHEFLRRKICEDCGGARIGRFARAVTFDGRTLPDLVSDSVEQALAWFESTAQSPALDSAIHDETLVAASSLLPEIINRLKFLQRVGVGYLQLNRPARSLSGGEFQRARLASCLGTSLMGVCYVLDEPTIGLHPRDTDRLIHVLKDLRERGNSVLVVEHDVEVMRAADWLIDLGPGAGTSGGSVVAAGLPSDVEKSATATSRFLRRLAPAIDRMPANGDEQSTATLTLVGCDAHNLQNITASIPLGKLVAITGVSGSGKTSLIEHTLVPAVKYALNQRDRANLVHLRSLGFSCDALLGSDQIERIVVVDQSPIGRSGRSNPATHSGVWDEVRRVLARTREARLRGFGAKRFSFLSTEGRCPSCQGQGVKRIEMNFLPDLTVTCPICRGARFNSQTLGVRFKDKNVAEILSLRIDEAVEFFENIPKLKSVLETLANVGLGYLELGQPSHTLSGGEAQRVKLATELAKSGVERTLYVLDEPTTGLHPADTERLIGLLKRLVEKGQSVVVVEHNIDVIQSSDGMIDLGPEGGQQGGQIVFEGPTQKLYGQPSGGHTATAIRQSRTRPTASSS